MGECVMKKRGPRTVGYEGGEESATGMCDGGEDKCVMTATKCVATSERGRSVTIGDDRR
jgi:hypothetical protein